MANIAIILGGGNGSRAGGGIPKQFRQILGKPILTRSIEALLNGGADRCCVVLHHDFLAQWKPILSKYPYPVSVVEGGSSRWHSVKNALKTIAGTGFCPDDLIAVHDAARPLVTPEMIRRGWKTASIYGTAVPVVPLTDSIRHIMPDGTSIAVDRSIFRAVQTPQIFRADILMDAYNAPYSTIFTDDASVVENIMKIPIALFDGDNINIKITNPHDFIVAESLLSKPS